MSIRLNHAGSRRALLAALLIASSATLAVADDEGPPEPDPVRPAIGAWTGQVSWNDASYGWWIEPDGTFSSGRLGRGGSGGGRWEANGARLKLLYADGFRYEGEVRGDVYSGAAYLANGRAYGGFSMWRMVKRRDEAE